MSGVLAIFSKEAKNNCTILTRGELCSPKSFITFIIFIFHRTNRTILIYLYTFYILFNDFYKKINIC